jgi:ABC-type nickel/cobalt efflux system permease component RcnA
VLHALAPGHGKTVMAAYLVGQRGTRRQAVHLGAVVTFTHTASVLLLGLLLSLGALAAPELVVPITEVLSGVLLAMVGGYLVVLALPATACGARPPARPRPRPRSRRPRPPAPARPRPPHDHRTTPHDHDHPHPHDHPHDDHPTTTTRTRPPARDHPHGSRSTPPPRGRTAGSSWQPARWSTATAAARTPTRRCPTDR